jgi:hypothetical protein
MSIHTIDKIIKNNKKNFLDWEWQKTYDKKFISLIKLKSSKDILKLFKNVYTPHSSHNIKYEYNNIHMSS